MALTLAGQIRRANQTPLVASSALHRLVLVVECQRVRRSPPISGGRSSARA